MTSRAAIAQLRSTSSKRANLLSVARCTGWAKREGASMLFLPECLGFMGDSARHTLASADPPIDTLLRRDVPTEADSEVRKMLADAIEGCSREGGNCDGPAGGAAGSHRQADQPVESIIRELQFVASRAKLWISGGGVHTRTTDSEKIHNTHVIIDSDGRIRAHYHKIHLFDVSIPGKVALRESNTTDPGGELVVVDSPLGRLGLGICYDMRFPEMYVELVRRGAEVLLAPSAFTVPTGRAHWHALLRARAIEGQCYMIAAAQVGRHNERRRSYGHSVAYDPWGELLADAGGYDSPGVEACEEEGEEDSPIKAPSVIVVDIVPGRVAEVRERMPIQDHRERATFPR